MSRAFVKGDDSDLPSEDLPERPISAATNYVTRTGLEQLRKRYEDLLERHAMLKAGAADFDKPKLQEIERDLRYFSARLDSAILVDVTNGPRDEVHFGATVKTEDSSGQVFEFTIVGEDEADVASGKVSWVSPLAKAMMGARTGDSIKWQRPAGETEMEILDIRYPPA